MKYRIFFLLTAVVACCGWIRGYPLPTFIGNPNATVASINTTTITASRSSGELPAFVQVSASAVTATGTMANGTTLAPYEDLDFYWDFGDPNGTESFTNYAAIPNVSVNANFQKGPEAAYVYRTAGTYTIRLTIRGCAVPPTTAGQRCSVFKQATSTTTFTASAFDKSGGEWWFDQVGGNDANPGTLAQPKQSLSALNTLLLSAGHKQIWLKRGSNWVGSTGIYIPQSDIRIGAYGSGAQPIVNISTSTDCSGSTGATCNAISWDNTSGTGISGPRSNIVVSNVDFWRSGLTPNTIVNCLFVSTVDAVVDNYLDGVNIVSDTSDVIHAKWLRYQIPLGSGPTNIQRFGMWGGSVSATVTDQASDVGFFGGALHWNFFVGQSAWNGAGFVANLDHHMYPDFLSHGLFRWMNFGAGPTRNMCINSNVAISVTGVYNIADYWLLAENNFTGTKIGHDASNSTGPDRGFGDFRNFVAQQNSFHALTDYAAFFLNALSMTWRYNNVWDMDTGKALIAVNSDSNSSSAELGINFKMYGNNIYQTTSGSQTSGKSPLNQKIVLVNGVGGWSNGSGGSGTVLDMSSAPATTGPIIVGSLVMTADASAPGGALVSSFGTGTGGTGTYNLSQSYLLAAGSPVQIGQGWTTPWTFSDNVVWDTSANATLMDLQFVNQATATVDRNQFYAPSAGLATAAGTGTPFFNNRFAVRFQGAATSLQSNGFCANCTVAQPTWANPAIGNFNFLLKRDLDPASNDNSPMWLEKIA